MALEAEVPADRNSISKSRYVFSKEAQLNICIPAHWLDKAKVVCTITKEDDFQAFSASKAIATGTHLPINRIHWID
jgi:hypothetical protein